MERPEPDLLTTGEAAERLGVSSRQVRDWVDRGLLPVAIRTGSGRRRWRWVRVADVEAFAGVVPPDWSAAAWMDRPEP